MLSGFVCELEVFTISKWTSLAAPCAKTREVAQKVISFCNFIYGKGITLMKPPQRLLVNIASVVLLISGHGRILNAQDTGFGIKGGLNLATWKGEHSGTQGYAGTQRYSPGLHLGFTWGFGINKTLVLEPGIFYSTKGVRGGVMQFNRWPGYYGDVTFDLFKKILKFPARPRFVRKRALNYYGSTGFA